MGVVALSIWSSLEDRLPADVEVGRWTQNNDPAGGDVGDFILEVGSTPAAWVTIGLVAVALAIPALTGVLLRRRNHLAVAVVALALLLGLALQTVVKEIVDRPRSAPLFLAQRAGFDSPSFLSGHAMSS